MSLVERANKNETGLATDQEENVMQLNERNRLVNQIEALHQEVFSIQRKAEVTMGQLQLRRDVVH